MDSVIKLDPNFTKIIEEQAGLDLKTAINEVRNLVDNLSHKGFNISLEELDLMDNYQIKITIKNNE